MTMTQSHYKTHWYWSNCINQSKHSTLKTRQTNITMERSNSTNQSESTPDNRIRNFESLCRQLSKDQNVQIEPEDLSECLKTKKIEVLTQDVFDMIIADFLESHSDSQLENNFTFFDTNGDGVIDKKEWKQAVKKLRKRGLFPVKLSKSEQKAMFKAADIDNNGNISIEEYKTMVRDEPKIKKIDREHRRKLSSTS